MASDAVRSLLVTTAAMTCFTMASRAQTLGMVAGRGMHQVVVFNADSHAVLGIVPLPGSLPTPADPTWVLDCAIRPDQKLGFVTDFTAGVYVIDLSASPPALATGINPIPISTLGEDLSFAPDGRHLLVTNGTGGLPVCVIDTVTRAEVSTLWAGFNNSAVECCADGSVLVGRFLEGTVRRATIGPAGLLTGAAEVLGTSPVLNVACAPGSKVGLVVTESPGLLRSFTIPGLAPLDTRALPGQGRTAFVHPSGDRVYVRTHVTSTVTVFAFDSATGAIGAAPLFSFPTGNMGNWVGVDEIAIHPNGNKVFVSEAGFVRVRNANDGTLIASIPAAGDNFGVCIAPSLNFGVNCKGFGNPTIGYTGIMAVGSPNLAVTLTNARPNTLALLYLSSYRGDVLSGPCTIYPSTRLGVTLSTMTSAVGGAVIPMPLPVSWLLPLPMYCQWMIADPGGPISGYVSLSDGLLVLP